MNKNEIRQAFNESYYRINKKLRWFDLAMYAATLGNGYVIGIYFYHG